MKKVVFVLALVLALAAPSFAANLLVNGDFEAAGGSMGAPGTTPGWTNWSNGYGNRTQGVKGSDTYNGGSDPRSGQLAWTCYCKSYYSGGIYQEVTVTPGVQYKLDGWWKGISDNAPPFWYEVGMINGPWNLSLVDGGITTTIWKQEAQLFPNPNTNPADYVQMSTQPFLPGGLGTNIITATSNKITVWIKVGSGNASGKTRVRVDDMTLEPVPEPTGILAVLTGFAGLVGAVRRRR